MWPIHLAGGVYTHGCFGSCCNLLWTALPQGIAAACHHSLGASIVTDRIAITILILTKVIKNERRMDDLTTPHHLPPSFLRVNLETLMTATVYAQLPPGLCWKNLVKIAKH